MTHAMRWLAGVLSAAVVAVGGCGLAADSCCASTRTTIFDVDLTRSLAAAAGPGDEWLLHGRTFGEERYSPLADINRGNASRLGLAWSYDLGTDRGLEATPLLVDGVLFLSSAWSIVHAIDARTGQALWTYDPKVPGASARNGCCDVVSRGVAVWKGTVFAATFDGRLLALDARNGTLRWSIDTIVDRRYPYSITGAPRIVKDKVVIGNGGAEFGVRGYVSAYDVESGRLAWRFYTVPRDSTGPFEHPELEIAARTWDKTTSDWHDKGGGTVWDSMAYDPGLDLLFVGTGNAPWTGAVANPGEGDKLFTASILALDVASGRLVWHYQETPGDRWDFTSTQHIILTDLVWHGRMRKVLMHAPKNGFFYILDRETGELLSAEPYGPVTWATRIDPRTRRPVLTERAQYWKGDRESLMYPWVAGDHNWHPMSYSPRTGLVYIPAQQAWWIHSTKRITHFDEQTPSLDALLGEQPLLPTRGYLRAWDPVRSKVAWEVEYSTLGNGGTLATAGDVVFQGAADGTFNAYDARTGALLRRIFTGTGIIAPPMTYRIDGTQYVAVLAGFGGATLFMTDPGNPVRRYVNQGRLLVFKLDGGSVPLPPERAPDTAPHRFTLAASPDDIERGISLYRVHCGRCHGMLTSRAMLPDLRVLPDAKHELFEEIVLGGLLSARGMASFSDVLGPADVRAIQAALVYLRDHPAYGPGTADPRAQPLRPGY